MAAEVGPHEQRPAEAAEFQLQVPVPAEVPEVRSRRVAFMTVNEQAFTDFVALTRENRLPEGGIEVVRYDPRLTETQDKVKDDIGGLDGLIVNAYLPTFSRAIALSGTKPMMVRDRACPDGYPWLIDYHRTRAEDGNRARDCALVACQTAQSARVPWIVYAPEQCNKQEEKGAPASVWEDPRAVELAGTEGATHGALHMCVRLDRSRPDEADGQRGKVQLPCTTGTRGLGRSRGLRRLFAPVVRTPP